MWYKEVGRRKRQTDRKILEIEKERWREKNIKKNSKKHHKPIKKEEYGEKKHQMPEKSMVLSVQNMNKLRYMLD